MKQADNSLAGSYDREAKMRLAETAQTCASWQDKGMQNEAQARVQTHDWQDDKALLIPRMGG